MKMLVNDLQVLKEKLQVQNCWLQYDVYYDLLIGMFNCFFFWQWLQEIVNQVCFYKGCVVVMFFDFDSFKDVNDIFGYDVGDKLLQDLVSCFFFFCKIFEMLYCFGGDEFVMFFYDFIEEMVFEWVNVIWEKISQFYQIYDVQINIDVCIGIVIFDGESCIDYLYKCVDFVLYEVKKEGSGYV